MRSDASPRNAMKSGGLEPYSGEWWHFDGPGAGEPRPIFDVPVNWSSFATGAVILSAVALDSLIRGRRRHARQGLDL